MNGLPTCPHCGALLHGPSCMICGKTDRDKVDVVEKVAVKRGLTRESKRQLAAYAIGLIAVVGAGAFGYLYATQETERVAPTALAAPPPTSSTIAIDGLAERTVAMEHTGRHVLTGATFTAVDHQSGIDAVAARLAGGATGFVLADPARTTWNDVDLVIAEATQPFAARSVADESGAIADVWIISSGPEVGDASASYFEIARSVLTPDNAISSTISASGNELHQLSDDGSTALWVDTRDTWMAVYWAPTNTEVTRLAAISDSWG